MNIAIVNDVALICEGLRRVVESTREHRVAWIAHDGLAAVALCREQRPDLILMDLVMPQLDGVAATRQIMTETPCPILIVTSSVEDNAAQTFDAMGAGALDAMSTPLVGASGEDAGADALLNKIHMIGVLTADANSPRRANGATRWGQVPRPAFQLVGIGASSGGPMALATILKALPAHFPLPVVLIQHVDALFAPELAVWLDTQTRLKVCLARDGERLRAGCAYLSGRNDHLVMSGYDTLTYTSDPLSLPYRPSVDVFFDSMNREVRGNAIGVLLTGMGRDGAQGLLRLRQNGHMTIAQDQASSAVYGMPRAAAELKAAQRIVPLTEIASTLVRAARGHVLLEDSA